jgi:hypothetical protein
MQRDPEALYSFDGERDASQSKICRQGKGRDKECITVRLLPFRFATTSTNRSIVNFYQTTAPYYLSPLKKKSFR